VVRLRRAKISSRHWRLVERHPAVDRSLAAVVYFLRDCVRFARSAHARDVLALVHETTQQKSPPRVVGVSLSGTPLLAEASLGGARLSSTSLSGILMLANASLYDVLLGCTLGLAGASQRLASLSDTLLLVGAYSLKVWNIEWHVPTLTPHSEWLANEKMRLLMLKTQHWLLCHLGLY
jgi:hypothetical protein